MKNTIKFLLKTNLFCAIIFIASCNSKSTVAQQETDFCASIHRNDSISLSKELEDVKELMNHKMFVKGHCLHKLKINVYTKLVSNLVDCCLCLRFL